jgi:hypothetical protein
MHRVVALGRSTQPRLPRNLAPQRAARHKHQVLALTTRLARHATGRQACCGSICGRQLRDRRLACSPAATTAAECGKGGRCLRTRCHRLLQGLHLCWRDCLARVVLRAAHRPRSSVHAVSFVAWLRPIQSPAGARQ